MVDTLLHTGCGGQLLYFEYQNVIYASSHGVSDNIVTTKGYKCDKCDWVTPYPRKD